MRIAALDLGSNSIKITVAEREGSGPLQVIGEKTAITRVGQDLDKNGRVLDEAMQRTLTGLDELVGFARRLGVERKIACVGTAGLRGASNAGEFLRRAKMQC